MIAAFVLAGFLAAATPPPRAGEPVEEAVRQNSLIGDFVAPRDGWRGPAVIVLGGFEGGVPHEAFSFARAGYAGFAVAYFGAAPLPRAPDLIPVESVSRALDYLLARPEVDPNRIGIVGISKGSELALLAAARDSRIKSVAVVSPSAYVWFAPAFDGERDRSSWTADAGPLPFIAPDRTALEALGRTYQSGGTIVLRELYDASLAAAPGTARAAAAIPVERIHAPVLCIAGDDDREWDSAGACKAIAARRAAAHADARDRVVIEPGAGHALSLTGRPSPETIPSGRVQERLGGTMAANARAASDVWTRVQTFFGQTL